MQASIDLTLPDLPGIQDNELFQEFLNVYNAIKILVQGLDDYTLSGDIVNQVEEAQNAAATVKANLARGLRAIAQELEAIPNFHASHFELRKQYYRYTVPKFTVSTNLNVKQKFSLGDPLLVPPVGVQTITKNPSNGTSSGAGVLAGAFDSAATRDANIAAITANAAAITEIQNFLKLFGFLKT